MTVKQLNQQNPQKFVMVTYEYGAAIYIAPLHEGLIDATDNIEEAEKWSYADSLSAAKLGYHKAATGYKGLMFEVI